MWPGWHSFPPPPPPPPLQLPQPRAGKVIPSYLLFLLPLLTCLLITHLHDCLQHKEREKTAHTFAKKFFFVFYFIAVVLHILEFFFWPLQSRIFFLLFFWTKKGGGEEGTFTGCSGSSSLSSNPSSSSSSSLFLLFRGLFLHCCVSPFLSVGPFVNLLL